MIQRKKYKRSETKSPLNESKEIKLIRSQKLEIKATQNDITIMFLS